MRFANFLLVENQMADLYSLADSIIDQLADEGKYDHDMIINIAKQRLENDPNYADPTKLNAALEAISNYVR